MNSTNTNQPPDDPLPQETGKRTPEIFFVNAGNFAANSEIKLIVEFSYSRHHDIPSDISIYFKIFTAILLSATSSIFIRNWSDLN